MLTQGSRTLNLGAKLGMSAQYFRLGRHEIKTSFTTM